MEKNNLIFGLDGFRVAILAADGFEKSELFETKQALDELGASTSVVSVKPGAIRSWDDGDWGEKISVDLTLAEAKTEEFNALLLPGGVMSPDTLRIHPDAVAFVQAFVDAAKPIAAICHGPQMLIETSFVRGRKMTSWPSLKTDLENAGAEWVDEEVVYDQGLITSRKPADIPAFNQAMIDEFRAYARLASGDTYNEESQANFKNYNDRLTAETERPGLTREVPIETTGVNAQNLAART